MTSTGYRPSQGRRIRAITRLMTGDDIRLAQELAGPLATPPSSIKGLEAERRTRVLDLAVELLQYSYAKEKVDQDSYRKRILPLLTERSRLGGQRPTPTRSRRRSSRSRGMTPDVSASALAFPAAAHLQHSASARPTTASTTLATAMWKAPRSSSWTPPCAIISTGKNCSCSA